MEAMEPFNRHSYVFEPPRDLEEIGRDPAITQHLRTIFESGELAPESVIKNYLITATDGKNYKTKMYSLEVAHRAADRAALLLYFGNHGVSAWLPTEGKFS